MNLETYASSGVDILKADKFVERLKKLSIRKGHESMWRGAGGYAAVYPTSEKQGIAVTTDGVGTKVLVTNELKQYDSIGIDLVAMCANDLICVGAKPVIFLDYLATGKIEDSTVDAIMKGIVAGCDETDMLLVGGETAEMPGVYDVGHYDLAGFAVGMVAKDRLLTGNDIKPGQTLIGVASSGIHSNGFSLARKVLADNKKLWEKLLVPTLLYVKPVNKILDNMGGSIKGIAHITGGGWTNLFRLNAKVGYNIKNALPVPEILAEIGKKVDETEMHTTFNMGMGLALITDGDPAPIIQIFNSMGYQAQVVGSVTDQAMTLTIEGSNVQLKG